MDMVVWCPHHGEAAVSVLHSLPLLSPVLSCSAAPGLRSLTNYFQACTLDICKLLIRATREKSRREMEAKLHH